MNRSSIIALAVLGAILAYFLTFGAEGTRKLQAGFYKVISPFLTSGSGIKKQLTAVSGGLQTLEELERDNASLKVENRSLKATNQALRDVEHEVNRLRRALNYRDGPFFAWCRRKWWRATLPPGGEQSRLIEARTIRSSLTSR
jgi:Cell shape-determining protein